MATNWSQTRMRTWLGVVLAVAGAILLVIGWYNVSGETDVARQLPYVVSASVPGAALLVAGAVLFAAERWRDSAERSEQKIDALYALLTEPAVADRAPPAPAVDDRGVVAVAGGTRFHRPDCTLADGKPVTPVSDREITDRHLEPCPVCDPPVPASG
jgi:hypothetical protein